SLPTILAHVHLRVREVRARVPVGARGRGREHGADSREAGIDEPRAIRLCGVRGRDRGYAPRGRSRLAVHRATREVGPGMRIRACERNNAKGPGNAIVRSRGPHNPDIDLSRTDVPLVVNYEESGNDTSRGVPGLAG